MNKRMGRFGPFLGCSKYPDCKGIVNIAKRGEEIVKPEDLPSCPAIGCDGRLNMRKSRFGKTFYSCSNYPDCDVIVNNLADLESKYPNHPKTAYVKKTKGKFGSKAKKGKKTTKTKKTKKPSSKPAHLISAELAAIVGANEISRPEATKQLWIYIKENNLQDPKNKRTIVPDAKLAKVIGNKPIDMMKLAGALSKHFKK